jgi:hypothetical protein
MFRALVCTQMLRALVCLNVSQYIQGARYTNVKGARMWPALDVKGARMRC